MKKYTKADLDEFYRRTDRHCDLVYKYAKILHDRFPQLLPETWLEKVKEHDQSKYEEPEFAPYIRITRAYKDGTRETLREPEVIDATRHHITHNSHHPEFHKPITSMPLKDIAELACDWMAMAEELGTSVWDWYDKVVGTRFAFNHVQTTYLRMFLKDLEAK